MADTEPDSLPSLRNLASSESKLRRETLQTISEYLISPTRPTLTTTTSLMLWRGLIVALLMHDSKNAISVQNLTKTLSSFFTLIAGRDDALSNPNGKPSPDELECFTSAFWETMVREYTSVDSLRVDKVLLLMRFAVRQIFRVLFQDVTSSPSTEAGSMLTPSSRIDSQTRLFAQWPLSPRERRVPDGIRYHVLDLWVDELELVKAETLAGCSTLASGDGDDDDDKTDSEQARSRIGYTLETLMQPIQSLAKEGLSKSVRVRAKDVLTSALEKGVTAPKETAP